MPQSLTQNIVHIIFSTKDRKPRLSPEIRSNLYPYIAQILKNLGCIPYEIGGTEDHVHILCEIAKTVTISDVIRNIKTGSSNWMKNSKGCYDFFWQHGYGLFSVRYQRSYTASQFVTLR